MTKPDESIPKSSTRASPNDDDDNEHDDCDGGPKTSHNDLTEPDDSDEEDEDEDDDPSDSDDNSPSNHLTTAPTPTPIHENSRLYPNPTYFLPIDSTELTRNSILHQSYLLILHPHLTLSHIPPSTRHILDIGSGPADWALAASSRFPDAQIIATDISSAGWPGAVPGNVRFEIWDAGVRPWGLGERMDFVHVRGLVGAWGDWVGFYKEAFRCLRMGGVLEVADFGLLRLAGGDVGGSWTAMYNEAVMEAAERAGTPLGFAHLERGGLEGAGFSVARRKTFRVPVGEWMKEEAMKRLGKMALIGVLEGLEAVALRLLTREGWSAERVREVCEGVVGEVVREGERASVEVRVVVARKLVEGSGGEEEEEEEQGK